MAKCLVNNTLPRIVGCFLPTKPPEQPKAVVDASLTEGANPALVAMLALLMTNQQRQDSSQPSFTPTRPFNLIPGVQIVDAEQLAEASTNAIFAAHIKNGDLVIEADGKGAPAIGLSSYVQAKAIEVVNRTLSIPSLDLYLEEESRPKVVEAIAAQRHKLKNPGKKNLE